MNLKPILLFWHRWRCAIWTARLYASESGDKWLERTALVATLKGEAWKVRLKMQNTTAEVMLDYHRHMVRKIDPMSLPKYDRFIGMRWVHFYAAGPSSPERWVLQQGYVGQDKKVYWRDVPEFHMPRPDAAHHSTE